MIEITNALSATGIFMTIFFIVTLLSLREKTKQDTFFSQEDSQELKGFAILAIILAHVGYILVSDNRFLQPYSYFAGTGVDIFLILSGFGLAASMLKNRQSVVEFYQKRLKKLYIPMWIVLVFAFVAAYLVLGRTYSLTYLLRSFAGIFTTANAYSDINSPLWYFTFILLYYLLFPIIFSKKFPWVTSIIYFVLGYVLTMQRIPMFANVIGVYRLHILAFPLGILLAWFSESFGSIQKYFESKKIQLGGILYSVVLALLLYAVYYFGVNSGVGKGMLLEESISVLTAAFAISFMVFKNFKIKFFSLFGIYSYEIYLTHWPIAYLAGFIWKSLPTWEAMTLYMVVIFLVGVLLQKLSTLKKTAPVQAQLKK